MTQMAVLPSGAPHEVYHWLLKYTGRYFVFDVLTDNY